MAKEISRVQKLTEDLCKELKTLAALLEPNEKLQAAVNAKISAVSFARYTKGDVNEIRNLELAEKIITEMKKFKKARV